MTTTEVGPLFEEDTHPGPSLYALRFGARYSSGAATLVRLCRDPRVRYTDANDYRNLPMSERHVAG